jgi:hypothetical protein
MNDVDITEQLRRVRLAVLNAEPGDRPALKERHGDVWDGVELGRDFEVIGFMAPLVVARRRSDGMRGSLEFQHHPRFYFNWRDDK